MKIVQKLLGGAIGVTMAMGIVAVLLMMVHISIDVVAKYLFGLPMPGTITVVSNYYMVLVAFLPLAFTERKNAHISVEVVTEHFPPWLQGGLKIVSLVFCAAIFAAMTWQSWIEAGRAHKVGAFEIEQNVKLLIWPARYLLPLGCGLMTLTLLVRIAIAVRRGPVRSLDEPYF